MSHSYSQNLIHCVYSTIERRNRVLQEPQERLWSFSGVIAKREGIHLLLAGGTANHIHLLIALPPTIALSKTLQTIKSYSSRWMTEHGVDFKWQEGYGAFSVSPSQVEGVEKYIRHQAEHHKNRRFEEEFAFLLKTSVIDYDPRYVFG